MSVELRRAVLGPELDPELRALGRVINRLIDRDNGHVGGRLWLVGADDGDRREILGGAVIDSNNYRFRSTSEAGKLGRFEHSNGTDIVLDITDAGLAAKGTLGVTGNSTLTGTLTVSGAATLQSTLAVTGASTLTGNVTASGTLTVTGATLLNGAVTLGDAAADAITVPGTMTVAEILTLTKGLVVDTTTLVVDAVNNRVGIGTATPAAGLDVAGAGRFLAAAVLPASGAGLEAYYGSGNCVVQGYDRTGAAFLPLLLLGSTVDIYGGGTAQIKVSGTGVGFFGGAPVAQPAAGSAADGTLASATTLVNSLRTGLRALGLFS